ncbi:LytR C-terminal domain-containing protein [Corynebacterium pseudokroppenstedtii]|uniref:LytR C-terminal domain-containing protein n=1 Tax=Corynebacterium pseudokroppenstedtii TaxID=2804917 RepID=UPI00254C01A5|nr:LytR C-terminal domain-containing protein [Corynebacterium pseudokroppenstedtii]MDK7147006.1 LytR C-terminal domain-containing protein [Corynebacterium pseudokroppenstedtii]
MNFDNEPGQSPRNHRDRSHGRTDNHRDNDDLFDDDVHTDGARDGVYEDQAFNDGSSADRGESGYSSTESGDYFAGESAAQGGYTGFAGYGSYDETPHHHESTSPEAASVAGAHDGHATPHDGSVRDSASTSRAAASEPAEPNEPAEPFDYDDRAEYDDPTNYDEAAAPVASDLSASEPARAASAEDQPKKTQKSKVPLRTIGVILLIVAVALIAFGIYHLVSGDKDDDNSSASSTSSSAPVNPGNTGAPGAGAATDQQQPGENANNPDSTADQGQNTAGNQGTQNTTDNGAAAQDGNTGSNGVSTDKKVDKSKVQVTVLNNSRVQGLAEKVSKNLNADSWTNTSFGNLPADGAAAFPGSVVLYDDNADSKAAATEVATALGLKAQPKNDQTNQQLANAEMVSGQHPGSVVVVTTADMNQ